MRTGFKDRTKVPEGKKIESPWNFEQPPYDERTSCFINAGTHYGKAHTQPVGKFKADKYSVPLGRVDTMHQDPVHKGKATIEVNKD